MGGIEQEERDFSQPTPPQGAQTHAGSSKSDGVTDLEDIQDFDC
jgi:hypothetical protein